MSLSSSFSFPSILFLVLLVLLVSVSPTLKSQSQSQSQSQSYQPDHGNDGNIDRGILIADLNRWCRSEELLTYLTCFHIYNS